jgi:hypothetical protein
VQAQAEIVGCLAQEASIHDNRKQQTSEKVVIAAPEKDFSLGFLLSLGSALRINIVPRIN